MTSAKAGSTSFAVPEPWTVVADGYDAHTRGFLARFSLAALDYLVLEPTFHVLDVGCGPGTTVLQLARRVEALTAVDFSSEMLRALQNHLSQEGIENVTVLEADGQQLPMQGERFELALSMFGLMFFPDRPRGLSELIRVLRPGGQVLIGGWAPVSRSSLMGLVFDAMQAADPAMGAPPPDLSSYQNRQVLEQELRDAGFVDVRRPVNLHGSTRKRDARHVPLGRSCRA